MKKNEKQFKLEDFQFKIVNLNVFTNDKEYPVKATFYLLVDQAEFIHSHKVVLEKIWINESTTKSHQLNYKKWKVRKEILDILGLKIRFNDSNVANVDPNEDVNYYKKNNLITYKREHAKKLSIVINDPLLIKECNEYLWEIYDEDQATPRNIEYILCGHNPKGTGQVNGFFQTNFKHHNYEKNFSFNLFLKTLDISNKIKLPYKEIWDKFKYNLLNNETNNIDEIDVISFNDWINQNKVLKDYFIQFDNELDIAMQNKKEKMEYDLDYWKRIMCELEQKIKKNSQSWININNKVSSLRNKQVSKYMRYLGNKNQKKYEKNSEFYSDMYFDFFDDKKTIYTPKSAQFCHIKPVYLITKQALDELDLSKREELMNQISDINNFLPLTPNVHTFYDVKKVIYWNLSGEIMVDKAYSNDQEIECFSKIKDNKLKECKKYIKDYLELIQH